MTNNLLSSVQAGCANKDRNEIRENLARAADRQQKTKYEINEASIASSKP
jgi:hypothetical protein